MTRWCRTPPSGVTCSTAQTQTFKEGWRSGGPARTADHQCSTRFNISSIIIASTKLFKYLERFTPTVLVLMTQSFQHCSLSHLMIGRCDVTLCFTIKCPSTLHFSGVCASCSIFFELCIIPTMRSECAQKQAVGYAQRTSVLVSAPGGAGKFAVAMRCLYQAFVQVLDTYLRRC